MERKGEQVQIRVTREEKARLRRLARRAGMGLSEYMLRRSLPAVEGRYLAAVRALRDDADGGFALAELSDTLSAMAPAELERSVAETDLRGLSDFSKNYLAAIVEYLCAKRSVTPPAWVREVRPLDEPWFAVPFASLRAHLLRRSPVAFRRRNLFVDAGPDARV